MARNEVTTAVGAAVFGAAAMAAAYTLVIRPWHLHWGATREEAERHYPGDDFVPQPKLNATHAVTIHASRAEVWPWLVQLGQGRGGFYSYDWLENMMGLRIHSADEIRPELQGLKVGDRIPLAPDGFGIPVAILDPERAVVMHGDTRTDPAVVGTMKQGDFFHVSWALYLEEADRGATRLVERWRADWNPGPRNALFLRAFLEPGAFLMERQMLLGIKQRAEKAGALQGTQPLSA